MKYRSMSLFMIACIVSLKAHAQPIGGNGRKQIEGDNPKIVAIRNEQNNWLETDQ